MNFDIYEYLASLEYIPCVPKYLPTFQKNCPKLDGFLPSHNQKLFLKIQPCGWVEKRLPFDLGSKF